MTPSLYVFLSTYNLFNATFSNSHKAIRFMDE